MNLKFLLAMFLGFIVTATAYAADARLGVQVKGDYERMFISGDGQKAWYSALELEQIALAYAGSKKLDFNFEGTDRSVWVHTDGGKVLAEVWFHSGAGKPALRVDIGRKGNVLKHKIEPSGG